jgi:glycosyltransferase involved in cell wall biosynthesis
MCVYNDQRYVGEAIESILGQSFREFEFLIIDDGSTDGTPAILDKYAAQDSRIRIFRQQNAGATAAANKGLQLAVGEYVARLDSDDISFPYRLEVEVEFLAKHRGVGLVGGGAEIIGEDGHVVGVRNIIPRDPAKVLRRRCIYQQSDVMFDRNLAIRLGGYREKFRNAQDYDLWLRISEATEIAKIDRILGQWRLNAGGYTLSRRSEQKREVEVIRKFAERRRVGKKDEYEQYVPPVPEAHRCNIDIGAYRILVGSALIQSLRLREARSTLRAAQGRRTIRIRVLIGLTFLPAWFVALGVRLRDAWLNHLG